MSLVRDLLSTAVEEQRPLILLVGQHAWGNVDEDDSVLARALSRVGQADINVRGWRSILDGQPLSAEFYDWLAERFERRVHPGSMEILSEIPWSAVFTSSLDPTLNRLLSENGREPETILTNSEVPRAVRSRARPPLYYLFGRAGVGDPAARPPADANELNARRTQNAVPMLNRVLETATAVGFIIVDGFTPGHDWLRVDDLLGTLASASVGQVLWFGGYPELNADDQAGFDAAVRTGRVLVEPSSLSAAIAELRAVGRLAPLAPAESEDVGVISFGTKEQLEVAPELRLRIEAVASIVDDSWTAFLPPLGSDSEYSVFRRFHGHLEGPRLLVEGVRRGFSIEREFETELLNIVRSAVANHASIDGPIIVRGQSGTGKSVALARVVARIREEKNTAVLYSIGRVPQSEEVSAFCEVAEESGARSTIIVCDSNRDVDLYYDLLMGLRSRGRRVIVLGSQYLAADGAEPKWTISVDAPVILTKSEQDKLAGLLSSYFEAPESDLLDDHNMLAFLYRFLPPSRPRISVGLGDEAIANEQVLRAMGRRAVQVIPITKLHQELIRTGFIDGYHPVFDDQQSDALNSSEDVASRIIDLVMVAGRLNCPVPINLLLRAAAQRIGDLDITMLGDLFGRLGLFRWESPNGEGNELLVAPRLTLEAQLICNRRLGTAEAEASRLMDLIGAVRFGIERDHERSFLLNLLQQINPDGHRSGRYKNHYASIARELTRIRLTHNVADARLMLQESAFRRAAIRENAVSDDERFPLLEEARDALQTALDQIATDQLRAPRRTRQNLLVERAALYGFLSTDRSRRKESPVAIWTSYEAARTAVRQAATATESYYPLDVGLWTPADLLDSGELAEWQRDELVADIYSTLDQVEQDVLRPSQRDSFDERRMKVGMTLRDHSLTEEAFAELENRGSVAGYYLRARDYAPSLSPEVSEIEGSAELAKAAQAVQFLQEHFNRIERDPRCLLLLLECRWIAEISRRPLRGERQPLPYESGLVREFLDLVRALNNASQESARYVTRYLEATLSWLLGEYEHAGRMFSQLADDTDFENPSRVVKRHLFTGSNGAPRQFEGRVERQRGEHDWAIRVEGISPLVRLRARDFPNDEIAYGRTIKGFGIGFNFIGPIVDPLR